MPAQPQHRVGEHARAAPARAAVDEHSRLRLIVQHPRGEASRRRPHRGPLSQAVILHRRVRDPPGPKAARSAARSPDHRTCTRGRQLTTCVTPCSARHATVRADDTPLIAMRSSPIQFSAGLAASGPGTPRGRGRRARKLRSTSTPALRYHRNTALLTRPRHGRPGHVSPARPQSHSVRRLREPVTCDRRLCRTPFLATGEGERT